YTGTMSPQGYGIIRVYEERVKAAVTVRYVDENGDPLQDDFVSEPVYVDTGYEVAEEQRLTTLTKDSKLYTFVTDGGASYSGTMKEGGIEIVRVYREQGKEVVTVHYVDTEGNQLIEDMTSNPVYVGKTYNVAASLDFVSFIKDGIYYVFDSDGGAAYTGTMVEGGIEITRVYREQDKRPVTVRFTDEDGKELQADAVYGPFYVGRSYDASEAQDILTVTTEDGSIYDFVSDADAAYTGVMTEDGAVITRVYRERAKASVTVHFVDEAGNALQADTVFGPAYVDSEFDVSEAEAVTAITKDGKLYDFVSDEAAAYTGTLTENGTEITRVYKERAKATVTVHYVDKDGNKLLADTVESVYVDTVYDVTGAKLQSFTKDGKAYEFVGDADAAYTGTMTADGVEITRIYKLKPAGGSSTQTPVTGDRGFGLWAVILMMSASMLPMLVFGKRRPRRN
ncbi:MAG: MucBP domain-containing protein, partial [Oscillospiraceae bacterium]|nr:MucBP domain-containing protein [Oscillospiraceae bacterium]